MSAPKPATSLVSVYDGTTCLGHVIDRGKTGFEAFDTQEQAANALLVKEGGP